MRPPVVKRQTRPKSGFYPFFSAVLRPSVVRPWQCVPSAFPSLGAPTWLHQTLIEVLSLLRQRVQRPLWRSLYDLEISLSPHPVLCKGVAERMPFASGSEARRGGSTGPWDTTIAASLGAGADVQSKAKGSEPKGLCAPRRSMTQRNTHCRARHAGSARRGPVRRWAPPL